MKKKFFVLAAFAALVFTACNSNTDKAGHEGHDRGEKKQDTTAHDPLTEETGIKKVQATFTNVDGKAAAGVKEIVDHYLHIKNALASDNAAEAARGGEAMLPAINKMDKSLLTAEQKKVFDAAQDDLKEHAERIGKNGGNIKQQREYFAAMSGELYSLVKAFGAGRPLYHDHCPMYNDNKGGMWMSEIKDVKNPYFGADMLTCGKVEEVIE
ncbi:MAG: DUF3347 domain-containing protein [Sphingobacteriales bacterium]|nr:DUF3347 domain-containing protein [Sphingobacteriales bacterium]OJW31613.1 MAG: hypothetical protein BGO54_14265 [Sphingobacteriales bacterium 46-32]